MPKRHHAKDVKGETIHPYSRKATQLQRALLRDDRLARQRRERAEGNTLVLKLAWLQANVDSSNIDSDGALADDTIHSLIQLYLERHQQEIDQMEAALRRNRPKPPRLELLHALRSREQNEYDTGTLEMPDLTIAKNVAFVRVFEGDINSLNQLTLRTYRRPSVALDTTGSSSTAADAAVPEPPSSEHMES